MAALHVNLTAMRPLPFRPAAALLSRSALSNNLQVVRERIRKTAVLHHPGAKLMAVVKADAYGHEAAQILPALEKLGVRDFAVASLFEGVEARILSKKARVLVLGGTFDWSRSALDILKRDKLEVAVSDLTALEMIVKHPEIRFHLKLDTGMNRLGVKPDGWERAIQILHKAKLKPEGIFTHFATNQGVVFDRQVMLFEEAIRWFWAQGCDAKYVHSENSGALFASHSLKKGMLSVVGNLCRPGISLYGYAPRGIPAISKLRPVLELVSEVGIVKEVEKGEGVSYGHLYRAPKKHAYAVVPLGYADGISKKYGDFLRPEWRSSSNKKKGYLRVCGAICMDMVMVRAERGGALKRHDRVVFWGRSENPILKAGLVEAYELNLRIAKRIPRIWVSE